MYISLLVTLVRHLMKCHMPDHLIDKQGAYNLDQNVLAWIRTCLMNKSQRVKTIFIQMKFLLHPECHKEVYLAPFCFFCISTTSKVRAYADVG